MSFSICSTVGGNTGGIDCDVVRGRPVGLILGSATFLPADYVDSPTFQAAFTSKIKKATGSIDKLFPFPEIQGTTDKTDAPKEGSLGYGLKFILLDGKPAYEFTMVPGTTQEQKLRKFNKKTVPAYVLDDGGNTWGTKDTAGVFKGPKALISVIGKGYDDGSNAKATVITVSFISSSDFYDNAAFAPTSFNIGNLPGLVDGVVAFISKSTNVYKIGVTIPTTELGVSVNVYDYFSAQLVAGLFTAFSGANFTVALPITSVAVDATLKAWTFTFDATAFGLLSAGDKFKLIPAAADALDTANVTGLELQPIILTK